MEHTYEQKLLGAILKAPHHIDTLSLKLDADDFQIDEHRKIYNKALSLHREGMLVDYFIVKDAFPDESDRVHQALERLRSAPEIDPSTIERLINYIRKQNAIAKLKRVGADLINSDNYNDDNIDEILTSTARRIFEISDVQTRTEVTPEVLTKQMREEMELLKGKDLWGFPTGIPVLDKVSKGMQGGQTWVIGAYTNVGKSWVCLHFANEARKAGARVLYLSTEMVEKRLGWRFVTMNTGVREYDILRGELTPEAHERVGEALELLEDGNFKILSDVIHVDEAIFYIKRELAKGGLDVVILDFLQNLAVGANEYEALSEAIRKLQSAAIQNDVCMVVASQINRESMKAGLGGSFGYKGSGAIEAAADVGINLYRDTNQMGNLILDIKKNRNGELNDTALETDFAYGRIKPAFGGDK